MKEPGEPLIGTIQESVMQAGIPYYRQSTNRENRKINAADFAGSGFRVEKITKDLYVQVLTLGKMT